MVIRNVHHECKGGEKCPLVTRFALCLSLFCYALLCVHYSFAIILKRERKLVALLLLSYKCIVTINVLWLFLTVSWVVLHRMVVGFPDHTHCLCPWV